MHMEFYEVGNLAQVSSIVVFILWLLWLWFQVYKYFEEKRIQEEDARFQNYHKLIKDLVEWDSNTQVMLDRQIAIVFELRSFFKYYPVTLRILAGLKESWKQTPNKRILHEIDLTEQYITDRKFRFRGFKDTIES